MANDFTVHDVTVSSFPYWSPTGIPRQKRAVTFYVGPHGPFRLEYDSADYSPAKVKLDIQQEVANLRDVSNA